MMPLSFAASDTQNRVAEAHDKSNNESTKTILPIEKRIFSPNARFSTSFSQKVNGICINLRQNLAQKKAQSTNEPK